ncbi:MAG: hypothetical protein ABIZ70_10670 [Gemmatimonadales bacterium]
MTQCDELQERMPEVAHGRAIWSAVDSSHLADCDDCATSWRLVTAGASLGSKLSVDSAAISEALRARIRATAAPQPRRLPWRSGLGLLAAAASVALFFGTGRQHPVGSTPVAAAAASALLPELDQLSEGQLERVLSDVDLPDELVSPMRLPRLGDLNEIQLELVLRDLEGG